MRYPESMQIIGQEVKVDLLPKPLYQFHTCPKCEGYRFPVPTGTSKACPACGCEETRPVDNTYVLGQYVVPENKIKNWHSNDPNLRKMCETSFVHETIEAIDSICDLRLKHPKLTTLAASVYQALSTAGVDYEKDSVARNEYKIGAHTLTSTQDVPETITHEVVSNANLLHKLGLDEHQVTTCASGLHQAFSTGKVDFSSTEDYSFAEAA